MSDDTHKTRPKELGYLPSVGGQQYVTIYIVGEWIRGEYEIRECDRHPIITWTTGAKGNLGLHGEVCELRFTGTFEAHGEIASMMVEFAENLAGEGIINWPPLFDLTGRGFR